MIPFEKREKIIAQALSEVDFARNYKQSKTLMEKSLKIYERYYGKNHIQTIQILRDLERILSK